MFPEELCDVLQSDEDWHLNEWPYYFYECLS